MQPARMVRETHSPQKANSVKKREGGINTAQYSFPPRPHAEHARDHRRDPRDRMCYARPSPPRLTERPAAKHELSRPNLPNRLTHHCNTDTPAT